MKKKHSSHRLWGLVLMVLLSAGVATFVACSEVTTPELTPTPTRTPRPTATPIPSPTPTPAWPVTVHVPEGLPAPFTGALSTTMNTHPDLFAAGPSTDGAEVRVQVHRDPQANHLVEWVYAVVAPFPTVLDQVPWADVEARWQGASTPLLGEKTIFVTPETVAQLTPLLGVPYPEAVSVVPQEQMVEQAWANLPQALAIVPFHQLEPRWKVLRLDDVSVIDKDFDPAPYPLTLRVSVTGLERGVTALEERLADHLTPGEEGAPVLLTNRDPDRMSVVLMTGVTALTRATAIRMDRHGVTYPGEDIRPWLHEADITHVSNEVSFAENCPPPADYTTMVFCSDPSYIGLFEDTDIDVVELTGNHLLDWGIEAMELSLEMYEERELPYFGGGWDLAAAQQPLTLTHGVHTFGFVGCNPVGPGSDWATAERAGSAPCDYELLYEQVGRMREQGVIPIVTLQYWEFYEYAPTPQQERDFRALSEAGAVIVSGSQAHQPQAFAFQDGEFIHYGLGNLWFDQMWSLETRQEFLDRHVFYDGRHVSTELLTAILEDYARPRPMTPEERTQLLEAAFAASGW
jgi:poly-gamma-glutamate synthesis protein (capsule biosynthesis protein)